MSISEDLLHVNATLGMVTQRLNGEPLAVLHMISANLHALAEQVAALEQVPLATTFPGADAGAGRAERLVPTAGLPPQ